MTILFASVTGGAGTFDGKPVEALTLEEAVGRAQPGDTVQLLPGRYADPVVMSVGGQPGNPVTLRGAGTTETVLVGNGDPQAARDTFKPTNNDFAFLKLLEYDYVVIEHLAFEDCWPSSIYLHDSRDVIIRDCSFRDGRFAVYARSTQKDRPCENLLLERVRWVQDPAYVLWKGDIIWNDVKQIEGGTDTKAQYFNGALVGSYRFKRGLVVRECDVFHAFNAIRLDAGDEGQRHKFNRDIRIIGNRFHFIRDNGIEPEGHAENLWVVDNEFFNIHAAMSLDGVDGGHWYFVGNRILNARKPSVSRDEFRGGRIYKFHKDPPYSDGPFYTAFNSVQTRTAYTKKGQTRHWTHRNNAIGICTSGTDCDASRRIFGNDAKNGGVFKFTWHRSLDFDGDLWGHPDFPDALAAANFDLGGVAATDGTFAERAAAFETLDPTVRWDGVLTLRAGSPGEAASLPMDMKMPDGTVLAIKGGSDIGAPAPPALLNAAERNWVREAPVA